MNGLTKIDFWRSEFDEFMKLIKPLSSTSLNYLVIMPNQNDIDQQRAFFAVGAAYVSSALKASGRNVFTLNLIHGDKNIYETLKSVITDNNVDVVLTGGLNAQFKKIKQIFDISKSIKPNIITIAGGGMITSSPVHAMQALEIADFGIVGEGEITVCDLAYALENKSDLEAVSGIVYKENGKYILTQPREELKNLDIIPWPDYKGFSYESTLSHESMDVFVNLKDGERGGFISYGRSCPFNCTFCFHPSGKTYRQRSLDSFFNELDYVIHEYRVDNLFISDELLFIDEKRTDVFCCRMKPYNIKWTCCLRVDSVTETLIARLKESGCVQVSLGLESANNHVLKSMRKHITVEQIENALDICLRFNMTAIGNFIFGDVEETYETAMDTVKFLRAHPQFAIYIKAYWISVYPGTQLYNIALEHGFINDPVEYIKNECPLINVSKMSMDEQLKISSEIAVTTNKLYKSLINVALSLDNDNSINAEAVCPYCNKKDIWTNINVFPPVIPPLCKCGNFVSIYAQAHIAPTILRDNTATLITKHKIAIWPVTMTLFDFFKAAPALNNENVYLVDSSIYKQGTIITGKRVHSPDIIINSDIDTVVIPTVTKITIDSIKKAISEKYPTVNHVITVSELCMSPDIKNI